jgi:dTMP kinase
VSLFITFEGPEGSGKTTQIRLLADQLEARGHHVLTTREPGGTRIGNGIRSILLDSAHTEMSPRAEALLFSAARAQLVDEVIRPALENGAVVLCDRYADSTLAYQGYGHGQALEPLVALGDYATNTLMPDLTIYLDVESEMGLQRKQEGAAEEWNRMEEQTLAFHRAVRAGYLKLATAEPQRWLHVNAAQAVDSVQQAIWQRVEPFCLAALQERGQRESLDLSVQHEPERG